MNVHRRAASSAALFLLVALAVGCGKEKPKLAPVSGKATHKGAALTAGAVYLHPATGNSWVGEPPSSQLELDGSFTPATYPHGQGVPPGEWKVTLSSSLAGRIRRPDYADPAKTPLKLTVPDGGVKDHVLEIK